MIRGVLIAVMTILLCVVLYTPSVIPPDRFVETIKRENAAHRSVWGDEAADRILTRLLDAQQAVPTPQQTPVVVESSKPGDPQAAMARQVNDMGARLFANAYFKSIDGLFALATYRACALLELAPFALVVLIVVLVDGLVVRKVRSKEFLPHSAEAFSISAVGAILIAAALTLSLVVPFSFPPTLVAASVGFMLFVLSRAVANYHLIGR